MIVVFGSVNLDLIFRLDALPEPGQTLLAEEARLESGGKGANQAVAAARDGAHVIFAGAIGCDGLAEAAMAGLHEAGVDVSRVVRASAPTGYAAVSIDRAGRNHVVVAAGANRVARAGQVEDALLRPGTTLLVQMETDAAQVAALIERGRAGGARVILNFAPAATLAPDALSAAHMICVNEDEAAWLGRYLGTGGNAASLQAALGADILCTRGPRGSTLAASGTATHVAAFPVQAVDTTGAGDAYVGVLAAALDRGLSVTEAMRRAAAAAALCCRGIGTQPHMPQAHETDRFLTEHQDA